MELTPTEMGALPDDISHIPLKRCLWQSLGSQHVARGTDFTEVSLRGEDQGLALTLRSSCMDLIR